MRKSKFMSFAVLVLLVLPMIFDISIAGGYGDYDDCSCCIPGAVFYLGKDTITKGDWQNAIGSPIGVYGSYAHILPNPPIAGIEVPVGAFSVPVGGFTYQDYGWTPEQIAGLPFHLMNPPYWDEYVSLVPEITYFLTGTLYDKPGIGLIQYPTFEWAWDYFNSPDPRAAHFKTDMGGGGGPGTRLTCWDDGSERHYPLDGYLNVTMTFPEGYFMLSLYAYDKERWQRTSQTIYVTNEIGEVLDCAVMSGTEFDEGIYLQFLVGGPTTIVVQVKKGPESINALLSGIFVDKVSCRCVPRDTRTIGFWKTNLAKLLGYIRGKPQVNIQDMLNYIEDAADRCPDVFGYLKSLAGQARLEKAYQIFKSYSLSMLNKAKAQFFALLLNVASAKALEEDIVAEFLYDKLHYKYLTRSLLDYPFTLRDVIDLSSWNIISLKDLEFTKDMSNVLNNGYTACVLRPA